MLNLHVAHQLPYHPASYYIILWLIASNCMRQSGVLDINFHLVHTDIGGGGGGAIAVLTNIIDSADAWMKFTGWLLSGIDYFCCSFLLL